MNGDLRRRQSEDQPSVAHVHVCLLQHGAEERSIIVGAG